MTKTESAEKLIKTLVIESCEQLLDFHSAEGVRAAIPNTNNLIMVGPQEWIAKNVPGVEAMVEASEQPGDDQWIFDLAVDHESRGNGLYGPITFSSTALVDFVRAVITRLAATAQASTAQAEIPAYEQDLLDIVRSFCSVAQRLTELTPAQRENYPSPLSPWSPLFQAASAACVERGYTEWGLAIEGVTYPVEPDAATSSTDAQAAAEVRDAALEEAADALELLNDPAGDAAAYNNRDMDMYEEERMHAIQHCINTIRALRAGDTGGAS